MAIVQPAAGLRQLVARSGVATTASLATTQPCRECPHQRSARPRGPRLQEIAPFLRVLGSYPMDTELGRQG